MRRATIQHQRAHENVGGGCHFKAVVPVRGTQRVNLGAGPASAWSNSPGDEQCVRVRRNDSFALLPD